MLLAAHLSVTSLMLSNCETAMSAPPVDSMSVPGFVGRPSLEATLVDIRINGIDLQVPRNYLETAHEGPLGAFIRVVAVLPKFSSATDETIDQIRTQNRNQWPNIITLATVSPEIYGDNAKKRILAEKKASDHQSQYGLLIAKQGPEASYLDIFFSEEQGGVAFACSKNLTPPRCSFYVDIAPELVFVGEINREALPEWRAVHEGAVRLLRSFLKMPR